MPHLKQRLHFYMILVGSVLMASGLSAQAQNSYPQKPIKLVVPVAAGGGTDFIARLVGQKLGEALSTPVIIENKPGGGGNVGVDFAAKSEPDGYTLVMPITSFPVNPGLYKKLPFDTKKDFVPITLVASAPLLLVINPQLPVKSLSDLIKLAKDKPGALNYATSGVGTTSHLAAELFKFTAGLDIINVPYKGGGPAVTDLIAGNVQLYFSTVPAALPQTKAGKIRALAVTSNRRLPGLGEVPTVSEAGLPGYEVVGWFGLFAPAKTPPAIVERLNAEVVKILKMPDVREKIEAHGLLPGGGTSKELSVFLDAEIKKWTQVIKAANITQQ
ncbi:MAG: Bug family tripartite tricarboxylate transporter substrate binding protein [Betaproteobacteria bacterium]